MIDVKSRQLVREAYRLRGMGLTLYQIAVRLGVTKEWLRTYAGIGES